MSNDTIAITVAAFLFLVWAVLYFWTFRTATAVSAPIAEPDGERDYVYRVNANGIERGDW